MKENEKKNSGSWICCPECGVKHHKGSVCSDTYKCQACGAIFSAWAVKGFVTVFLDGQNRDTEDVNEKFLAYHKQLMDLSD